MTELELERALTRAEEDVILETLLWVPERPAEAELNRAERRWLRLARESARRDYSRRSHGRRCACADCLRLLEVWVHLWRRSES